MCDLSQKNPDIGAKNARRSDRVRGGIVLRGQMAAVVCQLPVCSRPPLRLPALLLALLSAVVPCFAPSTANAATAAQSSGKLPTLTTAIQVHSLSSKEAARAYPVHLKAVVTYFDPDDSNGFGILFLHDSSGGIFAKPPVGSIGVLLPGTLVDVTGVSAAGGFAPIVEKPQIKAIAQSHLPDDPLRVNFSRLMTGTLDGQWVETEGVIRSVFEYDHNIELHLAMMDGTVDVTMVREPGATYSGLIDAQVLIRANAAPLINGNGQMIGVHLLAPNLSAVKILTPAPQDPFKQPTTLIDNLLRWNRVDLFPHRVHLRGQVTLQWPGSLLCIRDATRGICAQTAQDTQLAVGDTVDLIGFAGVNGDATILTDATSSRAAKHGSVAAQPVTAEQALLGKHDSELIQIEGQLIGNNLASSESTLLLASGKTVFTAILPQPLKGPEIRAWKIGSRLRVTGICSLQLDAQRSSIREGVAVVDSVRVLMRSPQDVVVLESPSWWTPGHALVVLALALFIVLFVLAWVVALRNRVEQQTILIRESEQRFRHMAQHDSLTGLPTRRVLNDRLQVALEICRHHQKGLGLLMLDVDNFKVINDTFGHQAGDAVLRATANRLQESVRTSDMVVRLGGDEFVALLSDLPDSKIAETIAAAAVAALSLPVPFEGLLLPVSVSVGIATAFAGELDAEEVLKRADAALYQAKARGRHCFQVFTPDGDCAPIGPHPENLAEESNPASTKCA